MKLLIVEDNPAVRRMIRLVVSSVADEIEECAEGGRALAAYAGSSPDFVLMDINLGDTDGIATTAEIRRLDPAAKVMIVTNYDRDDLRRAASDAGAFAYVLKQNLFDLLEHLDPA